jgi:hypothetical protein
MDANEFVSLIEELKSTDKPFSLATIDPAYTTGLPKLIFDGDTVPSAKGYSFVNGYNPSAGDRVVLANMGNTHVILGGVVNNGGDIGWRAVTFQNGASDYGSSAWSNCGYQKANGRVQLSGLFTPPATVGAGVAMFTLPEGCRPKTQLLFGMPYNKASEVKVAQVNVYPNGGVSISTSDAGGAGWLAVDGISFIADGGQPA